MATATASHSPVNQKIRIAALRVAFLLALPLIIFSKSIWMDSHWIFEVMEVTGIALIIVAVLGRFWAVLYIGARKNAMVMQDGPYSIMRHPLYLFSTIGVAGFGMMLGSFLLTLGLTALIFAILSITASKEEAFLRAEFGPAYDAYAARVPRILPKPSLFRTEANVTFNVRTLRINLQDALVFLALIPLAEASEMVKDYGLIPTFPLF
ncbi:methyltransferase family protein [Pseudotabrizicola algicola]|uniref:Isoprenylcysteine carboxylmethyltransferase family protein n=1 Tax=Pseudotabrizicola algicola TaxID=2709381 RepID=A0A6B3RT36_9RHOB|nr:isoprenylcysteine carboxylmethyltransferase family protein [Pseudotabrizicola algicola]NEX46212.1 isoprenylcysteine carboxylmethyltransferase family protein [Pseudotabrizicola algicola]